MMLRSLRAELVDPDLPLIPGSVLYVGEVRRRDNSRDCSFCGGSGVVGVEGEDGTRCTVDCPADCLEGQVYDGYRWEANPKSLNVDSVEISWQSGDSSPEYKVYADYNWRNVNHAYFQPELITRYFMSPAEAEDWAEGWAAACNAQDEALAEDHRREADRVRLIPEPQLAPEEWIWCHDCGVRHPFDTGLWSGDPCPTCHSDGGSYIRIFKTAGGSYNYNVLLERIEDGLPLTGFPPPGLHVPELQDQGAD